MNDLSPPEIFNKSITVIGCGIIGLTTALKLQEKGFKVTIVAKERFNNTLSSKVGAIWFPYEVYPKTKTNIWSKLSYKEYQMDQRPGNGISFIPFINTYDDKNHIDYIENLPQGVAQKTPATECPIGVKHAITTIVPLAEPQLYLPYLFHRFKKNGGVFLIKHIQSLREAEQLDHLVINCTGLGAKSLCDDADLQPMRGQILRCKKMDFTSFADPIHPGKLSYAINRTGDCIIGGTDYLNNWNLTPEVNDTREILNRFTALGLTKNTPEILEEIVGLRPKRSSVRFEFDNQHPTIFHNYGHGGAGFTVAWGCAIEVCEKILENFSHT